MKVIIKRLILIITIMLVSPLILFTRLSYLLKIENIFNACATFLSLIPGKTGSYMRVSFYLGTLKRISPDVVIGFGSFFSRRSAEVGKNVYIGAYCIIGNVCLENDILIASRVSIPSGKNQHGGRELSQLDQQEIRFDKVTIGRGTWIGEGAIVMADVGRESIIGSGSVVTKPIPDKTVAMGNPAKPRFERTSEQNA